jgi:hypothetical protein
MFSSRFLKGIFVLAFAWFLLSPVEAKAVFDRDALEELLKRFSDVDIAYQHIGTVV